MLYPNNIMELHFDYKGKISITNIYEELYKIVVEDIPSVNSDIKKLKTDKKINKYYTKNEYINKKISNIEEFKVLVNILKDNNVKHLELEYSEIIKSSCKIDTAKTEFNLKVKYKNCKEIIIKVIVYNQEKNNVFIRYIPIIEE